MKVAIRIFVFFCVISEIARSQPINDKEEEREHDINARIVNGEEASEGKKRQNHSSQLFVLHTKLDIPPD